MFGHELYKLLCNKVSVTVIAVVLAVNVFQLMWRENNAYYYPTSAYNRLWEDLEDKVAAAAVTADGDVSAALAWQEVLSGLKEEYSVMRAHGIMDAESFNAEYTGYLIYEMELYERVIAEVEETLGYGEYIAGIAATAARFESMGNLVERDGFVYRNLVKSAGLYAELGTDFEPIPAPSAGVVMAAGSDITDFIGIVVFLFFGISAWLKEKEEGVLVLTRTSKNGRYRLAATKLLALITVCVICGVLLYASDVAAAGITYGIGDLTRPLASVGGYRGTLCRISVGEFLVLNLLVKLAAYIWLVLLISVICNAAGASVPAFGSVALVSAGGWLMYTAIPALSAFAVFKYLNPFGIIKSQLLFKEFKGINILGYPFDYRKCVAAVLIVGAACFVAFTMVLFVRKPLKGGVMKGRFAKAAAASAGRIKTCFISLRRLSEMHVSVLRHEFYRIFISGGILFVVAVALVISVMSNRPYRVRYMNLADYYERQYLEYLEGPVTEEKRTYLEEETLRLKKATDDNEREQKKAVAAVNTRLKYLDENTGTYFVYDEPFGLMTASGGNGDDIKHAVIFMVLLALSMPSFFAPEWQTGMHRVVSVTVYGRRRLWYVRMMTGVMLTAVLFLITFLPPFVRIFKSYGMSPETFSYPAGSLPNLAVCGTLMSTGTYLVLVYVLRFAAGVAAALLIYRLSVIIKSHLYTMAAAFALLLIPSLLAWLDEALEFAVWPYAAFAGNLFWQNKAAAAVCVATVILVAGGMAVQHFIKGRRRYS